MHHTVLHRADTTHCIACVCGVCVCVQHGRALQCSMHRRISLSPLVCVYAPCTAVCAAIMYVYMVVVYAADDGASAVYVHGPWIVCSTALFPPAAYAAHFARTNSTASCTVNNQCFLQAPSVLSNAPYSVLSGTLCYTSISM